MPRQYKIGKLNGYSKVANSHYYFNKDKFVQASMKFVLKNLVEDGGCLIKRQDTDSKQNEDDYGEEDTNASQGLYLQNLHVSNESVNWRDVVEVRYDMVNSDGI